MERNKIVEIDYVSLADKINKETDIIQLRKLAIQLVIELKDRIKPIELMVNSKGKIV